MFIQCTKKLLDELGKAPVSQVDEEALFSWHANIMRVNRRKTVVLVNDKNRYVIVLYGLKARDFKSFDNLVVEAIRETLRGACIKDEVIDEFMEACKGITYGKTKDRTSIARMNKSSEAVYYYTDNLNKDTIYQSDLSREVNHSFVTHGKNNYIHPDEEMYRDLEAFTGKSIFGCEAVKLRVRLDLEQYDIWREIVVPLNMTFSKLHRVLQVVFGWKDYHLHDFYIYGNEICLDQENMNYYIDHKGGYKPVVNLICGEEAFDYPNEVEMRMEKDVRLYEYIPQYKRMKYTYDFGDNWAHYIDVKDIIEDYEANHPICLDGKGTTPPEDVGGEGGYEGFLEVIGDEEHEDYEHTTAWGKSQGYKAFDIEMVNRGLKAINK